MKTTTKNITTQSNRMTSSIRLLLLLILANIGNVHGSTRPRNVSRRRATNLSNHIQMSVVNEKYKEYISTQDNFISATLEFEMSPVKHVMDESQKHGFEKAMTSFLKSIVNSQTDHQLTILAATVSNSQGFSVADTGEEKLKDDNKLSMLVVISAQQTNHSNMITPFEFAKMIINLCSIYKFEMIKGLRDEENANSAIYNQLIFQNVESVNVAMHEQAGSESLSAFGGIILTVSICAVVALIGCAAYSYFRRG